MEKDEALICRHSIFGVLGCLINNPDLLDDLDHPLKTDDFNCDMFYQIMYSLIYNLHSDNCKDITPMALEDALSNYPDQHKIFNDYNWQEWFIQAKTFAQNETNNFDYYYKRVRKFSMLRYLQKKGYDVTKIYNFNLKESKAIEEEETKFDKMSMQDIVDIIESELVTIPSMEFCVNTLTKDVKAGDGLNNLIDELMEAPNVGVPLQSPVLTTACRGMRLGCLYMRSGTTGSGKSRLSVGDACKISVPYFFNIEKNKWEHTGFAEPTVYITTELPVDEIQTIIVATVSGVNEEHILYGKYEEGELERVHQANIYIDESPLFISHIPDFSIEDIKNIVKRYKREMHVNYFFFDYIQTSLRLMSEIGTKSRMSGLKEHQLLLVFATELKTICQQLNVFIMTGSQLNGEANLAPIKDQNLLAGSKALANKLDLGCINSKPTSNELKKVESILQKSFMIGKHTPNSTTWIYKIRRGKLCSVIIWSYVDLGTMRIHDLFVTNNDFVLQNVDLANVEHVEKVIETNSIAMKDVPDVSLETLEVPTVEKAEELVVDKIKEDVPIIVGNRITNW